MERKKTWICRVCGEFVNYPRRGAGGELGHMHPTRRQKEGHSAMPMFFPVDRVEVEIVSRKQPKIKDQGSVAST